MATRGAWATDGLEATPYAEAFPHEPRRGIAAVAAGAAPAPTEKYARITFATKEALKATGAGLAAADAEKEGVLVQYSSAGGVEHRHLLASVGAKPSIESVRKATVAAVNKARALKLASVAFELPAVEGAAPAKVAAVIAQAAALTNYHFDRYLTLEDKLPAFLASVTIISEDAEVAAAVKTAATLAEGTIFARDVCNERADEMHPGRIEAIAAKLAADFGLGMHVLRGNELFDAGLHMFFAVGQSARHAPRYIELQYKGDPEHPEDVIAVVGKTVCFDTGGLNLKPTGAMEEMYMDKGGGSAVLGAALATARLGIKRNVVFVLGAVENSIDSASYKPYCVLRSLKGLTVQNMNTDAEGRLVLGDALTYVQFRHKPHTVLDMATLTGACVIALGEYAAGLFSNSKALVADLQAAGETYFERLWHMPILPEHREEIKGADQSDIKSTGAGRYGGSCTAAAFLENFIGHEPSKDGRAAAAAGGAAAGGAGAAAPAAKPAWAHIDLAGPAMYSAERGFMKKGGTGFGASTVVSYLLQAPAGARKADE